MSANAFNVLKHDQSKWISSGIGRYAEMLTDEEGEYAYTKTKAYAIAARARANYRTPDSDAPSLYEKTDGYINGSFINPEYISETDYGLIINSTVSEVF